MIFWLLWDITKWDWRRKCSNLILKNLCFFIEFSRTPVLGQIQDKSVTAQCTGDFSMCGFLYKILTKNRRFVVCFCRYRQNSTFFGQILSPDFKHNRKYAIIQM